MSRTVVDIPDDLIARAQSVVGPTASKAETVRRALREMVARHDQLEVLRWVAETAPLEDLNDREVKASARG